MGAIGFDGNQETLVRHAELQALLKRLDAITGNVENKVVSLAAYKAQKAAEAQEVYDYALAA